MLLQRNNLLVRWRYFLMVLIVSIVTSPLLHAAPPAWWTTRGVLDPNKQANDYAAVNQGQVKLIAEQAMEELEEYLPGGIGGPTGAIHTMVDAWGTPTATTNDFSPVNLGALKNLAAPFYDQLIRVGYTTTYPWNGSLAQANDFAAANIGQVKNLFSFDLTSVDAAHDANGDGLPDWWENYYHLTGKHATDALAWNPNLTYLQAFQQGLNPNDYYNGNTPSFSHFPGDGDGQHGAPGEFLPLPLIVSALDANRNPLVSAPLTFTVSQGGGKVQKSSIGSLSTSITVLTDYNGQAKAFFQLSANSSDLNQVVATPGSGTYSISETFNATADHAPGSNPSPFDPSNVVATMNSDGSGDVSWTNNADPSDTESIDIMYKDMNGAWQVLTNVPAGTTSYHIPAP